MGCVEVPARAGVSSELTRSLEGFCSLRIMAGGQRAAHVPAGCWLEVLLCSWPRGALRGQLLPRSRQLTVCTRTVASSCDVLTNPSATSYGPAAHHRPAVPKGKGDEEHDPPRTLGGPRGPCHKPGLGATKQACQPPQGVKISNVGREPLVIQELPVRGTPRPIRVERNEAPPTLSRASVSSRKAWPASISLVDVPRRPEHANPARSRHIIKQH